MSITIIMATNIITTMTMNTETIMSTGTIMTMSMTTNTDIITRP